MTSVTARSRTSTVTREAMSESDSGTHQRRLQQMLGFSSAVDLQEIKRHDFALTPAAMPAPKRHTMGLVPDLLVSPHLGEVYLDNRSLAGNPRGRIMARVPAEEHWCSDAYGQTC